VRAALVEQLGEPPVVGEVAEPEPQPGQALIEVTAAPINPIDLSISKGMFYGGSPEPPYVPGREGVGRVLEGEQFDPGRIVYFDPGIGCMAERVAVHESNLIPLPDGADHALASCFGIAGLAGWMPLAWRAPLSGGEKVLILGCTGAVGTIALQAAKLFGAGRIVAAGRDEEGLERARELGADATVNLAQGGDLTAAFLEAAGGPIDVTVDPLWGEPAVAAIGAGAIGGRLVQVGQSAGAEATIASAYVRGKAFSILGFTNGTIPVAAKRSAYLTMVDHAIAGQLQMDRETLPLDWVGEAWRRQEASPGKKLVLVP
jgi:NADPH2:quinone reductase